MKQCSKCDRTLPESAFNKAKWIKSGLRSDCKECYAATKRDYWERKGANQPNRERFRSLKAEAAAGVRTCRSCGETKPLDGETFARNSTGWDSSCRECARKRTKEWAAANAERAKVTAYQNCANRYAAKRNRTPKWLTMEHRRQIRAVYAESMSRRQAGENVHVDHIIPLVGKTVSGLHVPWNLQILDASINCRKSNKWAA